MIGYFGESKLLPVLVASSRLAGFTWYITLQQYNTVLATSQLELLPLSKLTVCGLCGLFYTYHEGRYSNNFQYSPTQYSTSMTKFFVRKNSTIEYRSMLCLYRYCTDTVDMAVATVSLPILYYVLIQGSTVQYHLPRYSNDIVSCISYSSIDTVPDIGTDTVLYRTVSLPCTDTRYCTDTVPILEGPHFCQLRDFFSLFFQLAIVRQLKR